MDEAGQSHQKPGIRGVGPESEQRRSPGAQTQERHRQSRAWILGRNHPIYVVRPARFLGAPAVTGQEDGEFSRAPVVLHDARHRP